MNYGKIFSSYMVWDIFLTQYTDYRIRQFSDYVWVATDSNGDAVGWYSKTLKRGYVKLKSVEPLQLSA